jgi:hypothetical protein
MKNLTTFVLDFSAILIAFITLIPSFWLSELAKNTA